MVICTLHLSKVLNRLEVVRSSENDFFDEKYQCAQKGVKVHIGTFAKTNKEIRTGHSLTGSFFALTDDRDQTSIEGA